MTESLQNLPDYTRNLDAVHEITLKAKVFFESRVQTNFKHGASTAKRRSCPIHLDASRTE